MNDLQKLFVTELKDIYDGEQQLAEALGELEKNAVSEELKNAFREHLEQTRGHVGRIEQVFRELGESAKRKTSHALGGIIAEGQRTAEEFEGNSALDAALIAAAQKVEHYEITSYGSLCTWAEELGNDRAAGLLKENLKEEKETDEKLTRLATSARNPEAARRDRASKAKSSLSLSKIFTRELRYLFDAEHLLISALAELAFYADSHLLKFAIRHHKSQTEKHVKRLEEVFREIGESPDRLPSDGIEGIIDNAQVNVMEFLGNTALDAALIAGAQKAEHYEIATYGSLCSWAKELGWTKALSLLKENLSDEKSTDHKLTLAAELLRNPKAKRHDSTKRPTEMAEFLKVATHAE